MPGMTRQGLIPGLYVAGCTVGLAFRRRATPCQFLARGPDGYPIHLAQKMGRD